MLSMFQSLKIQALFNISEAEGLTIEKQDLEFLLAKTSTVVEVVVHETTSNFDCWSKDQQAAMLALLDQEIQQRAMELSRRRKEEYCQWWETTLEKAAQLRLAIANRQFELAIRADKREQRAKEEKAKKAAREAFLQRAQQRARKEQLLKELIAD